MITGTAIKYYIRIQQLSKPILCKLFTKGKVDSEQLINGTRTHKQQ